MAQGTGGVTSIEAPAARDPRVIERVGDLPVDVELELVGRRVPGPHGPRALVAGKPLELELREAPLAAEPVHDLELVRKPGDGAQEPAAPCACLVLVARADEREERERRVA